MPAADTMRDALDGLSTGDALGHRFNERTTAVATALLKRHAPPSPWKWTDDTLMACSVVEVLAEHGAIDADTLAASFVDRFEPGRGYGPKMKQLLSAPNATGSSVRAAAAKLFSGGGSFGNGAVMRVAPLGAFFSGDPERAAREGARSAAATHTHAEALAGASAVAVAASTLAASRGRPLDVRAVFEAVLDLTPPTAVRSAIERASRIPSDRRPLDAASQLGADRDISCQVTAPFCLWSALRQPDDYERALWDTLVERYA